MEAMASRSTEVDTSDCDEVTESRPPVLLLRGAGKSERDTEDCFSQSEYIEIGEVSGGDMSSRHECISRPDQQVESLMSMYQGYDYVEDEDGTASDMSFTSECISQPDQQSESLDSFRPVRGQVM